MKKDKKSLFIMYWYFGHIDWEDSTIMSKEWSPIKTKKLLAIC